MNYRKKAPPNPHTKPIRKRIGARIKNAYFRAVWPYVGGFLFNAIGRYRRIRTLADFKPGQRVVEVSSGAIPYYMGFRKHIGKTGMIVASDYHLPVLKDARRIEKKVSRLTRKGGKDYPPAHHAVFDSRRLPFKDGSVDRVISSYVYYPNVQEMIRILAPGGKAIMINPWVMHLRHERGVDAYLRDHGGITVKKGKSFLLQLPDVFTPFMVNWIVVEKKK